MGKLEIDPVIHHFSHRHPLHLQNNQSQHFLSLSCAACTRQASGLIYYCDTCNYCLHKTCSTLPQTHTHRVDPRHALALLSSPAYPEGAFNCNACGCNGTGFCYHCPECQIDVHPVCAFMPLTVKSQAHEHVLGLCFSPPYADKGFSCDICNGPGSNHWLYRCDLCEFDTHMKCAKASTRAQTQAQAQPQSRGVLGSQPQLVMSRSVHGQQFQQRPAQAQAVVLQPPPPPPPQAVLQPQYSCGGLHTNGSFQYSQGNQYGVMPPIVFTPEYVNRPQKSSSGIAGRVMEGLTEGIASETGKILINALMDDS